MTPNPAIHDREDPAEQPSWRRLLVSLVYFVSLLALSFWLLGFVGRRG